MLPYSAGALYTEQVLTLQVKITRYGDDLDSLENGLEVWAAVCELHVGV